MSLTAPSNYPCRVCGVVTGSEHAYVDHLAAEHRGEAGPDYIVGQYQRRKDRPGRLFVPSTGWPTLGPGSRLDPDAFDSRGPSGVTPD